MFSKGTTPEEDAAGGNNGEISGGAGFHTGFDRPAWWMVDLETTCLVNSIKIYNRLGLTERLRHFSILVSSDGLTWRRVHHKTDDTEFGGADGHPFVATFERDVAARFIKVQQDDDLFLHFDELQAFGRVSQPMATCEALVAVDPPNLAGERVVDYVDAPDVTAFGTRGRHERLVMMASAMPPEQIPMQANVVPHPMVVDDHNRYSAPPAVCAYAVHGGQLWAGGLVTLQDRFVLPQDCLPSYLRASILPDGHRFDIPLLDPARWAGREHLASALPVASVLHPNMIFGHFLLEMLPRLYVLSLMRQLGARFVTALPRDVPDWVRPFIALYVPLAEQLWYDPKLQIIEAPSIVLPSMLHEQHHFHPAFNSMVADLRARAGLTPDPGDTPRDPGAPKRLYLSRKLVGRNRRLQNEDEVETLMQRLGFTLVHPEQLPLREQLTLFDGAEVVAGEYSSALHNTMFCRPGTRVISIDYYSGYQSALGRLRQQPHGFVAPDDGSYRHWRLVHESQRNYRVDPEALRAMVFRMVPEAAEDQRSHVVVALPELAVPAVSAPFLVSPSSPRVETSPVAQPVPNPVTESPAWALLRGSVPPVERLVARPGVLARWFRRLRGIGE